MWGFNRFYSDNTKQHVQSYCIKLNHILDCTLSIVAMNAVCCYYKTEMYYNKHETHFVLSSESELQVKFINALCSKPRLHFIYMYNVYYYLEACVS